MEEGGWTARRPWRRGWGVGPAPGMARNGRRPRRCGTALVCGWRWDPALVFLVARLCPGVFWSPGGALAPVPVTPAARACRPLPTAAGLPPRPARATACVPFRPRSLRSGTEPASPHVGVVSRPPSAGGVPGWSSALGALRGRRGRGGEPWRAQQGCPCEGWGGRWYAAGERSPGPAAAPGVGLAVGVRPREGCAPSPPRGGGWPERPVCRSGCASGPPLCWEASGGEIPRCALAADSLPPGRFEPSPSRWRAATPASTAGSVALVSRGRTPSVPLSVRPSASVRSPSAAPRGPRPGVSRFPGPAAAPIRCPLCRCRRLSADVVAGWARGSARDPPHPPTSPPPPRPPLRCALPSAGRVPGLPPAGRSPCPRRPASPAPLGWAGRTGA